jgi:hypothetical protein
MLFIVTSTESTGIADRGRINMSDRHDNFDSQDHELPLEEDQARLLNEILRPYIGDWQALQDGTIYRQLLKELSEQGITLQPSRELPLEDPLARYKNIPLHTCFLYTSMDPQIEDSILKNYATLEGLARNQCDIYLSIEQFNNPAESLDFLEYAPTLKLSGVQIGYDDLPGMFFWNRQWEGEYISFRSSTSAAEINRILLHIFQGIREDPTIAAVRRVKQRLARA